MKVVRPICVFICGAISLSVCHWCVWQFLRVKIAKKNFFCFFFGNGRGVSVERSMISYGEGQGGQLVECIGNAK